MNFVENPIAQHDIDNLRARTADLLREFAPEAKHEDIDVTERTWTPDSLLKGRPVTKTTIDFSKVIKSMKAGSHLQKIFMLTAGAHASYSSEYVTVNSPANRVLNREYDF